MTNNYVRVAGGLGNQLFQVAFGISLEGKTKFIHFGDISLDFLQRITDFDPRIEVVDLRNKKAFKHLINLAFRIELLQKYKFIKNAVEIMSKVFARIYFMEWIQFKVSENVGYYSTADIISTKPKMFVGYFQSPKHFQTFNPFAITQFSINEEGVIRQYINLAKGENPVAIQVRLGDYLSEERFGIPGKSYFTDALNHLEIGNQRRIWIFTNDIEGAMRYLPSDIVDGARFIDEPNYSPFVMLKIMSIAKDFVISNSTFGWWGAYLSQELGKQVLYPKPWFSGMASPDKLFPVGWTGIQANYKENLER